MDILCERSGVISRTQRCNSWRHCTIV